MTLKNYLTVMSFLTIICFGIFLFVASTVDPYATNYLGFLLFYSSLFIFLAGIISLMGFLIRFVILKQGLAFNLVKLSFRQSFVLSLFLVLGLYLQASAVLTWLNLGFLIAGFSILEVFLISSRKKIS